MERIGERCVCGEGFNPAWAGSVDILDASESFAYFVEPELQLASSEAGYSRSAAKRGWSTEPHRP